MLVLEAGRSDWRIDPFIHMPAALTFPIGSRFYDWKYESEPEPFILAGGAINSPQILLLSGIGPAAELEAPAGSWTHRRYRT